MYAMQQVFTLKVQLPTMTYEDRKSFLQNSELGIELGIKQISVEITQTQVPTDTDLNTED
jgi:hypothetical protein